MAKKQKPRPAPADEAAAEPKPAGKKKLILVVGAVLLLAGGGGGWFMSRKPAKEATLAEVKRPVAFLDVQEMVVNLASEPSQERPKFLKLKVALEVRDAKVMAEVQPLLPRVQDIFQVFVRELRASDLEGSGGIHRLREELLRRVNLAIFPSKADAVLFKEVIVQ